MMRQLTATLLVLAVAFYACTDDETNPPIVGFDAGGFDASRPDATSPETGAADAPPESAVDTGTGDAQPDASDAGPGTDAAVDASDACVHSSGLVAWWPGDGTAQDIIGANHGTLQDGGSYVTGKAGLAFGFDGDAGYVELNAQAVLDMGTGDFTVDTWFMLNTLATDQTIFQKLSGATTADPSYFIEFNTPNALRFAVLETVGNRNDLKVNTAITTGTWHHFAGVRSGNTSTIYLDGVAIGAQDAGTNVNTGSGGEARIGRTAHNTAITRFVNGAVDELEIHNRALSPAEILQIATTGPTRCK